MKRSEKRSKISLKTMVAVCFSSVMILGLLLIGVSAQEQSNTDVTPMTETPMTDTPAEAATEPVAEEYAADIPRAPTQVPQEEQQFVYNSHGMRDPFVSLLISNPLDPGKVGLAAMKISELKIQGIQIGLGHVAIVLGTDGKAYNMEVGQTLLDGKVIAIESGKVVFEKIILDPFGREKEKQRIELYLHR